MPHEDATNGEIEFNTIEENCDLKEIVICEE